MEMTFHFTCGKRKVFWNTDSPLWYYCAPCKSTSESNCSPELRVFQSHLWMITGTLSCAFHATKWFLFLNFYDNHFFYFIFQFHLPLPPFLPLSFFPPHPSSHPILREGKASQGESTKTAPSSDAGPTPSSLYVGWARYP